jgi:hypothetical protein
LTAQPIRKSKIPRGEVHDVGQAAALRTQSFKLVAMFPIEERAGFLEVDEQFVFLVIGVDRNPAHAKGQAQHNACTFLDTAGPFQGCHGLPGWNQQLQSVRTFMEGKEGLNRGLNH